MPNLPISQLPESLSGSPDSLMVIVNYDIVPSGVTYSIPFSALTSQFNPTPVFQPVYGLFSQTGDSATVSGTSEQTIINGGVGTLSIPANGFTPGDTFRATIKGHFSSANDSSQIRVKADSVVLGDSGTFTLNTGGDEVLISIELYFVILSVGGAGTASILTKGELTTIKSSNFTMQGYAFESLNDTTFDTTTTNELNITWQFGDTNDSTYINTDVLTLVKVY